MNEHSFIIPVPPESINKEMKFGYNTILGVKQLKKKWESLAHFYCFRAIQEERFPEFFRYPIRISCDMVFGTSRTRDYDNYFITVKGIIDGINSLGVVADDSSEFVHFGGINFIKNPENPAVIVRVEELSPIIVDNLSGVKIQKYG